MTLETLAAEMNISVADLGSFVAGLQIWFDKGYTLEQSIERHMAQMNRFAANCTNRALRDLTIDLYDDLRAA